MPPHVWWPLPACSWPWVASPQTPRHRAPASGLALASHAVSLPEHHQRSAVNWTPARRCGNRRVPPTALSRAILRAPLPAGSRQGQPGPFLTQPDCEAAGAAGCRPSSVGSLWAPRRGGLLHGTCLGESQGSPSSALDAMRQPCISLLSSAWQPAEAHCASAPPSRPTQVLLTQQRPELLLGGRHLACWRRAPLHRLCRPAAPGQPCVHLRRANRWLVGRQSAEEWSGQATHDGLTLLVPPPPPVCPQASATSPELGADVPMLRVEVAPVADGILRVRCG